MTKLHLVTYGLGPAYDAAKFTRITNSRWHNKPHGGLWASTTNAKYGWSEWAKENEFGDLSTRFETDFYGNCIAVNSVDDLSLINWMGDNRFLVPDYEAMLDRSIDAIRLTLRGLAETHLTMPGLYGWDYESVLVMNKTCLKPTESCHEKRTHRQSGQDLLGSRLRKNRSQILYDT